MENLEGGKAWEEEDPSARRPACVLFAMNLQKKDSGRPPLI
jgi:hypothetical protein